MSSPEYMSGRIAALSPSLKPVVTAGDSASRPSLTTAPRASDSAQLRSSS